LLPLINFTENIGPSRLILLGPFYFLQRHENCYKIKIYIN